MPSSVAEIKKHVQHISFDRPIPKVMGLFGKLKEWQKISEGKSNP